MRFVIFLLAAALFTTPTAHAKDLDWTAVTWGKPTDNQSAMMQVIFNSAVIDQNLRLDRQSIEFEDWVGVKQIGHNYIFCGYLNSRKLNGEYTGPSKFVAVNLSDGKYSYQQIYIEKLDNWRQAVLMSNCKDFEW